MNIGRRTWMQAVLAAVAVSIVALAGCQSDMGGQVLPSGYYPDDDVQYFAPGPEYKLSGEAAAQKAYNAEQGYGGYAGP